MSDAYLPPPVPVQPGDTEFGFVVLAINAHGVAVAYGPYSEMEAHVLAEFLSPVALVVWVEDLDGDDRKLNWYSGGEGGPWPLTTPLRPVDSSRQAS